jgi:hypothetical protein
MSLPLITERKGIYLMEDIIKGYNSGSIEIGKTSSHVLWGKSIASKY